MNLLYSHRFSFLYFLVVIIYLFSSCTDDKTTPISKETEGRESSLVFEALSAEETGVHFINKLFESDQLNFFTYEYLYNGGGVSVADFNNDGFQDLFFTCNMGKNKMYVNKGNMVFEEISSNSGINSVRDWCTGTTITDINNDGLVDLYVSRSGWFEDPEIKKNLLYVNQGNFQFKEMAKAYGIDDSGHTTQSSFFDMDQDGDLDLYVMNHPTIFSESVSDFQKHSANPEARFSDQLYENVNGQFKNITRNAGITNYGHGLGLTITDFNGDMLPDIYVSNDYQQHDFIYINQGNKTFKEESSSRLKHQAKFSMGVDATDLSRNGSFDFMAVEMMPSDNYRQKVNMANMNPKLYKSLLDIGLQHQEMHNVLQVNSGDGYFTDVAYQYQVAQTDWSWSPLFGDFDSDGKTDLFVSNGYRRDVLNKDLKKNVGDKLKKENFRYSEIKELLPAHKSKNHFFKNNIDHFQDHSSSFPAVNSNGAAIADLDNDGDLDIICNNMEDKATIYKNSNLQSSTYVLKLRGSDNNKLAIGTSVKITTNLSERIFSNQATRGFQSSSGLDILFSLEKGETIEKSMIIWPDLRTQSISLKKGTNVIEYDPQGRFELLKKDQLEVENFPYEPFDLRYDDYKDQVLLPYKVSDVGPRAISYQNAQNNEAICIVDQSRKGIYFYENINGKWTERNLLLSAEEFPLCSGITSGDLNKDGLVDLYITRGNYSDNKRVNGQDLILLQKEDNSFERINSPVTFHTTNPKIADFNGDGAMDIFFGGGVKEGAYPSTYPSGILINREGKYEKKAFNSLSGIVKAAEVIDLNNDQIDDIVFTGEWMALHAYTLQNEQLLPLTGQFADNQAGWHNSLEYADLDGDDIPELIVGNIGNNTKMSNLENKDFHLYSKDYDRNGNLDIVFAKEDNSRLVPVRGKQCSSEQIPNLNKKFNDYESFAKADIFDIYGSDNLDQGSKLIISRYFSGYYKRMSDSYEWYAFPGRVQQSIVNTTKVVNGADCPLVYFHGNREFEVETGRLDGFSGSVLDLCQNKVTNHQFYAARCSQIVDLKNKLLFISSNYSSILIEK